jgi:hypothetical protein
MPRPSKTMSTDTNIHETCRLDLHSTWDRSSPQSKPPGAISRFRVRFLKRGDPVHHLTSTTSPISHPPQLNSIKMKFNILLTLSALLATVVAQGLGDLPDCSVRVDSLQSTLAMLTNPNRKAVPPVPSPRIAVLISSAFAKPTLSSAMSRVVLRKSAPKQTRRVRGFRFAQHCHCTVTCTQNAANINHSHPQSRPVSLCSWRCDRSSHRGRLFQQCDLQLHLQLDRHRNHHRY